MAAHEIKRDFSPGMDELDLFRASQEITETIPGGNWVGAHRDGIVFASTLKEVCEELCAILEERDFDFILLMHKRPPQHPEEL